MEYRGQKKLHTRFGVLAMLAVILLSGCGNEAEASTDEITRTSQTEITAARDDVPAEETIPESPLDGVDYDGSTFSVMTNINDGVSWAHDEFAVDAVTGDIINDAIFNRNAYISEKYNVVITTDNTSQELKNFPKTVQADENVYDLIMPGITNTFLWGAQGYLRCISDIPELDVTASWWNQYVLSETSVAHRNFFILGDMDLLAFDSTAALFFNKELASRYNLNDLYTIVKTGKWTFDRMMEYAALVSEDINGDGTWGKEDMYGLAMNSYGALCFSYGADARFCEKDSDDIPVVVLKETDISFFQKFVKTVSEETCIMNGEKFGEERVKAPQAAFKENRLLFYNEMLNRTSILRDMETDFGVLPLPKRDEAQDGYSTFIHQSCSSVIAVPMTEQNLEFCGRILEDTAYYSHYYLYPAYLETSVKSKFLRDQESEEMVDILLHGIKYDLLCVSGSGLFTDLREHMRKGDIDIMSTFAKKQNSYESTFNKLVEQIASEN